MDQDLNQQQPQQPLNQPEPVQNTTPESPKKILCIEDERFISDLYARALTNAGYDVSIINDGELGLHQASSGEFDIILLDIMLPTMNGVDLLYKLRGEHVQPPLRSKVIITTNLDQKEEVRKEVEKMADGYLIKAEITPKELVSYLQQVG